MSYPVAGIDLGGTNMQIGIVNDAHEVVARVRRKTEAARGVDHVVATIAEGVAAVCAEAGLAPGDLAAVGVAAAGAMDIDTGVVLDAPNLGWIDLPLRDRLAAAVGRPVVLENDVNGAVWGEYVLGAGRDATDLLGVWVGTGVGGGLVIDGAIHHGAFCTAGEIGHTILRPEAGEGRRTVEDLCSRTGMSRLIMERLDDHPDSVFRTLAAPHGRVTDSEHFATAYEAADVLGVEIIDDAARLLGIAIANLVTVLAIDSVLIGGGVAEALGGPFLEKIRTSFEMHVFPDRCRACRLALTMLEADAGLLGAALVAAEE